MNILCVWDFNAECPLVIELTVSVVRKLMGTSGFAPPESRFASWLELRVHLASPKKPWLSVGDSVLIIQLPVGERRTFSSSHCANL